VTTTPVNEPQCALRTTPVPPLSREELELETAPAEDEAAQALLVGIWDGHAYLLDGELGQPGSNPEPAGAETACFVAHGPVRMLADDREDGVVTQLVDEDEATEDAPAPPTGCTPRSRTYTLRREPQAANQLWLRVRSTGGCPGDASYAAPYTHVFNVHRLDDRFLVVSSGATGAVTAYRRR